MLGTKVFAALSLLLALKAAPVELTKRALPFLGGINLAGCDFGISTDGTSGTSDCPSTDQIGHFIADGVNIFRLPVGWQYLVGNNEASTSLDASFFATYDALVQSVLSQGAYAMIDVHNYARWDGGIIGQGGPTDAEFASLWSLLATKYKSDSKVIFGIMNEPHDLNVATWATTVQKAVDAIRDAGATTQTIAIPGTDYAHPQDWTSGANNALLAVTDKATGDNSLLILDVHQYLDSDDSGTSTECTTDNVALLTAFSTWANTNGRKAILSETGGGTTSSCITDLGSELKYVSSDPTFVGFTVWAAGSFQPYPSYALSITPTGNTDNQLFVEAVKPYLKGSTGGGGAQTSSTKPIASTSTVAASSIRVSSSKAGPASSSKAVSLSVSKAAPTTSTGTSTVHPTSTHAASSTSTKSSAPSAAPTTSGGNLQTYTGALGGIAAPSVTKSGSGYTTAQGGNYNFLVDALNASCYDQMNACQSAANQGGNKGSLTVDACNGQQVQACLKAASSA